MGKKNQEHREIEVMEDKKRLRHQFLLLSDY